jgi:hypothetical protein
MKKKKIGINISCDLINLLDQVRGDIPRDQMVLELIFKLLEIPKELWYLHDDRYHLGKEFAYPKKNMTLYEFRRINEVLQKWDYETFRGWVDATILKIDANYEYVDHEDVCMGLKKRLGRLAYSIYACGDPEEWPERQPKEIGLG